MSYHDHNFVPPVEQKQTVTAIAAKAVVAVAFFAGTLACMLHYFDVLVK
jgi:hypothetical protein